MPVINLILDPLDASNPSFVDPEVRKIRAKQAVQTRSSSDSEVENSPPTPPDSPSANLKPGIIVDSQLSRVERHAKSERLEARHGDLNAWDKNPFKTVVTSKSRETPEKEKEMRNNAAAARPKTIRVKLTPAGKVKNKGKIRARKQKVVGAEALMDLRVASEDQDKTSSTARTASKKNDSDEEDDVNSLFDETSDVENGNGNGCKIAEEEDMTNGEMIDVDSEAGLLISEDDSRRTSVRGSTEDAQPTTTHETHEVLVQHFFNDMTEAAVRNNDVVLLRALASSDAGVTIDNLDPVEELRVRDITEWYESGCSK
ncbi:hypothetical protein DL95DRAFT_454395 [Leptodontidium sp. 2 PMI_412]|nr:hypothetical protein DL95DRAFT_454395 [Leptodontidium sp. 2 PMI_412]